ncbi:hypothetical protein AB5N19_03761 [Seiridium cardinale]
MSPRDWDDYRDRIWCWYMVEDKELLEVLEILREDGFDVKKGQLEYRLKGWKMSKNITLLEAKWMSSQIAIRNKDNKPTAFVRSGKLLPECQVKKAVDRHLLPTLKTRFITDTSSPPNPVPMDLLACSPGPAKFGEDFWQASNSGSYLPWTRFQVALLDRSIRINIMPDSRAHPFQAELLSGIIGVTPFVTGDIPICRIAATLGQVVPELYPGQHVRRVHSIVKNSPQSKTDALELLLFQLSNNFFGNGPCHDNTDLEPNSENIIHLMESLGLDNASAIRSLFKIAAFQPTVAAALGQFWLAACRTQHVKLLHILSTENKYSKNGEIMEHLQFDNELVITESISSRDLSLAKALLTAPISPSVSSILEENGARFIGDCAFCTDHVFATEMATLLICSGVKIENIRHSKHGLLQFALYEVLKQGNFALARLLIDHRVDISFQYPPVELAINYSYPKHNLISSKTTVIHDQTVLTASIVPPIPNVIHDSYTTYTLKSSGDTEEVAIIAYFSLTKMIPAIKNTPVWLRDAADITKPVPIDIIILAAMYGYDKLLQKLIHNKDDLNQSNQQGMWPLCAAALRNKLSTCRYLLEKGADPNFKPPTCNTWSGPLHQAVYNNSEDLVRLFIEFEIDIENPCALKDEQKVIGCFAHMIGTTSALTAATALQKEKISQLLVLHNADISPLAFYMAVRNGHHDLVDMMLRTVLPVEVIDCRIATSFRSKPGLQCIMRKSPFQAALENHDLEMCDILLGMSDVVLSHDMLPAAGSAGNLKLVLRILETQRSTEDDQYISKALDRALEHGSSEAAHMLIRAGAEMSHNALITAFRSCPVRSLQSFIEAWKVSSFEKREEPLNLSSILDAAFANKNNDVVEFALRKYPDAYSSGALCLAVIRAVRLSDFGEKTPLYDLLRRRREVDSLYIDPVLENTALALAAHWNVPEQLLTSLLERPCPEALSFIPGPLLYTSAHDELHSAFLIDRLYMDVSTKFGEEETHLWPVGRERHRWTVSPLFLAVKGRNYKAISKMITQGYSSDENTVKAAITHITDLDMLELIICSCKYIHHGQEQQGFRDRLTALRVAVIGNNRHAVTFLLRQDVDVNARSYLGSYLGSFYPEKTVLQAAVENLRFQDDQRVIQQLLEAGADPNAPAHFCRGYTALQIAAGQGIIALAQQLIDFGADVNAPRAISHGRTCLENAADQGRLDMVQYLLNAGAATDGKGKIQYLRSLKLALSKGHAAISQILRQHRAWDDVDHSLFEDNIPISRFDIILHPLEYTPEEIRELRSICISELKDPIFWPPNPFAEQDRGNENAPDVTEVGLISVAGSIPDFQPDYDMFENEQYSLGHGEHPSSNIQTPSLDSSMGPRMPLHPLFLQSNSVDFHERIHEIE